jgi:hypothetical protein
MAAAALDGAALDLADCTPAELRGELETLAGRLELCLEPAGQRRRAGTDGVLSHAG